MIRTIAHLLTASAVAVGTVTIAAAPAQADEPRTVCTKQVNGEVCLQVWPNGRIAVSYKRIGGPAIIGQLSWWRRLTVTRRTVVVPETQMVAGQTYAGHTDGQAADKCYIGYFHFKGQPSDPWRFVATPKSCAN